MPESGQEIYSKISKAVPFSGNNEQVLAAGNQQILDRAGALPAD